MRTQLICFFILLLGLPLFLTNWLPSADHDDTYIIVLGTKLNKDGTPSTMLKNRLDAALSYKGRDIKYIVSGAGEAEAMGNYLIQHGINENNILVEKQARNTYENILNSIKLIPKSITSFTIISSDFHIYRAQAMASSLGYDVNTIGVKTPLIDRGYWQFREVMAIGKYWIIGN
ncbi:YdcF family protein [Lysinibacillus sp. KU-BSD001]|uniref:YdcF family protein n=1 Tax=Lysinibacillus sp. KU-BSD001 TaxID=3141328 RepID=UPI0036E94538